MYLLLSLSLSFSVKICVIRVQTSPPMLRSRLAPTPSGYLHLGNAFSFVLTWLIVRKQHGHLHLRIDDLDRDRAKPEYYNDIFTTLEWLGLDYDSGARSPQDCLANWSQRRRLHDYNAALMQLAEKSDVFACDCSRSLLAQTSHMGLYPGTCRTKNLPFATTNTAWRVRVPEQTSVRFHDASGGEISLDVASELGDFIVRRRDGIPAYHIASLVDDTLDDITFIVRGADLLTSTAAQIFLAERLGFSNFTQTTFLHHPLLLESPDKKLSKSHQSLSLKAMRENGTSPEEVLSQIASLIGITPHTTGLQALLEAFSLDVLRTLPYLSAFQR
jgi:glutamyl-tRNA synthetase